MQRIDLIRGNQSWKQSGASVRQRYDVSNCSAITPGEYCEAVASVPPVYPARQTIQSRINGYQYEYHWISWLSCTFNLANFFDGFNQRYVTWQMVTRLVITRNQFQRWSALPPLLGPRPGRSVPRATAAWRAQAAQAAAQAHRRTGRDGTWRDVTGRGTSCHHGVPRAKVKSGKSESEMLTNSW